MDKALHRFRKEEKKSNTVSTKQIIKDWLASKNSISNGDHTLKTVLLHLRHKFEIIIYKFESSTVDEFAVRNFKNLATPAPYYAEVNIIELISCQVKDFYCRTLK